MLVTGPLVPPRYNDHDGIAARARSRVAAWMGQSPTTRSAPDRSDNHDTQHGSSLGRSRIAESAGLVVTGSRQPTPAGGAVASKTMWANGKEYVVIGATKFDPSRSNGATVIPSFDHMAAADAGKGMVAVPYGTSEKAGFIVAPNGGGPLVQPFSKPVTRELDNADTLDFGSPDTWPGGTEALIHGHIDKGRTQDGTSRRSDGMVDALIGKRPYGDTRSLDLLTHDPIPTATVSNNNVGWHTIVNGQLQFMYPTGALTPSQARAIQNNLNVQQSLFYKP